jgi:DNA-binding transcriptional regulator YhcF (GntR family)
MKKLSRKEVETIRKAVDEGLSIRRIATRFDLDRKAVNKAYREYREEQIANSPRRILAEKIYQLQKASNRAIRNYKANDRPEYAYAVSSVAGELRATIQDLQQLMDVETLCNAVIDAVLYPNMVDSIEIFVKELGSARDQMTLTLDSASAKAANEILVDLIKDMKGKFQDLRLKGIQRMEGALNIKLEDRRNELVAMPDTKKPKLKVAKAG